MATTASNVTGNLGLSQWAVNDFFRREDFNYDNFTIDAAIASCSKIELGSYIGTGLYGENNSNSLTFDFVPKVLLIISEVNGSEGSSCGIFINGCPVSVIVTTTGLTAISPFASSNVTINDNIISWYAQSTSTQLNKNGVTYHYAAMC